MAKIKTVPSRSKYRPLKWVFFLILLAVIVLFTLQLTGVTHFFKQKAKPVATTGGAYTKGIPSNSNQNSSGTSTNSTPPAPESTNKVPTSTDTNLTAPWGTFANVYNASLSEQMGSTCNTTPGATCQIIFTNGDQTKSLAAEHTDSGGAVYWSWTPAGIGLTPGTWHITAKAVLGSQTKTTSNDPLTLKVTQ